MRNENFLTKEQEQLKREMQDDYNLVPLMDIDWEARELAVAWVEGYEKRGFDLPGKHKLASDIMNYARRYHQRKIEEQKKETKN